ncbi:MAG: hypothetical protein EOM12_08510 [Verrucomicrobiae bacterium]|nr:hypothetical protein [Verrucomicrobiae bacterium]
MTVELLRKRLFENLAQALPQYPVLMVTDRDSEKLLDVTRKAHGVVIWLSKTTNRVLTSRVFSGSVFNIEFGCFIETNPTFPGVPEYNDVVDSVIKAVNEMEADERGDYFSVYKTEEFDELQGNGLLTIYHTYEI